MKKIEWQECIRSGTTYHHIPQAVEGFRIGAKKNFGVGIKYQISYFKKNTLYWYYDKQDLYLVGKKIVKRFLSSKKSEDKFFNLFNIISKKILKFISENNADNLSSLDYQLLAKKYKYFEKLVYEFYSIAMVIDGTDEYLAVDITEKLKKAIRKKLGEKYSEKEFINAYNILTAPSSLSYLNDERKMLLEILIDLERKKFAQHSKEFNKKVKLVSDKFWWTSLGWPRGNAKGIAEIILELDELKKSKVNAEKELKEMAEYKQRTDKLKKGYSFDKKNNLLELLRLVDRLYKYHDYRKEIQMKYNFYEYQFLDEISKRTKINASLLELCDQDEIINLLENKKFNENEIIQRSKSFFYINIDGKLTKLSGKSAEKEYKKIINHETEELKDLQGMSACPGKVAGEAFVALTVDSALKIKKGQILVTGMTTPDFLPAMKKAVAFVTDEGGITCHAAIIAREFNKPCIVGTKIATKSIKTKDIIEVDANHGIVRKINKLK